MVVFKWNEGSVAQHHVKCILIMKNNFVKMSEASDVLTNLPIGHANKPFINQLVCLGVSGLPLHDVTLSSLIGQGNCRDLGMRTELIKPNLNLNLVKNKLLLQLCLPCLFQGQCKEW